MVFNLGGPDRPEAVRPFLFNLFNDPAIIAAPGPVRWLLAKLISARRAPVAREIYEHLGGLDKHGGVPFVHGVVQDVFGDHGFAQALGTDEHGVVALIDEIGHEQPFDDGPVDLTEDIPREAEEIEALMNK